MKKKLLSLIAVSAALATAGCALVACGGDDKGGNGDAKGQVTKEQWGAALSLSSFESNFKVNVKTVNETIKSAEEFTFLAGSQKYGDYSMTAVRTKNGEKQRESNRIRIAGEEQDAFYDRYSAFEDIQDEDGEWIKGDWQEGEWEVEHEDHTTLTDEQWTRSLQSIGLAYTFKFAEKYDSFEYKNGAYVLKGDKGIVIDEYASEPDPDDDYSYSYIVTATKITVKFDGTKLASAEVALNNHHESTEDGETEITDTPLKMDIKVSYGTQTITPPELPEKDSKAVTQSEWESAMSVEAFRNVTVRSTEKYSGGERVHNFKFDHINNAYYNQSGDSEQVTTYHKDGVDGKQYEKMLGEWEITIEDITTVLEKKIERMLEEIFLCEYKNFSYENGVYTALNQYFDGFSEDTYDIIAKFEDGHLVEFEMTGKTDNTAINYVFSHYGSTTIEVPSVSE